MFNSSSILAGNYRRRRLSLTSDSERPARRRRLNFTIYEDPDTTSEHGDAATLNDEVMLDLPNNSSIASDNQNVLNEDGGGEILSNFDFTVNPTETGLDPDDGYLSDLEVETLEPISADEREEIEQQHMNLHQAELRARQVQQNRARNPLRELTSNEVNMLPLNRLPQARVMAAQFPTRRQFGDLLGMMQVTQDFLARGANVLDRREGDYDKENAAPEDGI